MSLVEHAQRELEAAGLFREDSDYNGMLGDSVLELVKVFSDQGHSGYSAKITIDLFKRVADFEPLVALTGHNDEWNEVTNTLYQNNRCSHVFKENGQAYDDQAKVFVKPNGSGYTSMDSRVNIEFPYFPKTEYVDLEKVEDVIEEKEK